MRFQPQHRAALMHRLSVIGIQPVLSISLVNEFGKWVDNCGWEWSISRCKSIKVDILRRKTNLPPLTWIRKNSKGELKGPFGMLLRLSSNNKRCFRKCLQAIQMYTYFESDRLTPNQKKKFVESVTSAPVKVPCYLIENIREATQLVVRGWDLNPPEPLFAYRGSPSKRAPTMWGRSVKQDSSFEAEFDYFDSPEGRMLFKEFPNLLSAVFKGFEGFPLHKRPKYGFDSKRIYRSPIYGKIGFIQEAGFKLRAVASPYRWLQRALEPLGDVLYHNVIKKLPWDCTFDQSKAFPTIKQHLAWGNTVHSIDLSSATDYFPLEMQTAVMEEIFRGPDKLNLESIALFKKASRGKWYCQNSEISWTKGQPLGLYPSFAIFTLTHGLLLYALNGNSHNNDFFVVGDDVVIMDDTLYRDYILALQDMGCPWSPTKSISSNTLSEFAGKIVTEDQIISAFKWRKLSDDNFIDICRTLGPKSRSLLSRDQRVVFDRVKNLLPPIGLNFSTPHSSFQTMFEESLKFPIKEVGLASLVSLRGTVGNFLSSAPTYTSHPSKSVEEYMFTFDEKVREVFQQTCIGALEHMYSAFADLPLELGLSPTLPIKTSGTRVTNLARMLSLIKSEAVH